MAKSLFLDDFNIALATDLYQLTMAAAYFDNGCRQSATFELSVRRLPPNRYFLIAAGLEQALHYLQNLKFNEEAIGFLRAHPVFKKVSEEFFMFLKQLRFSGEVWAVPEGTVVFAEEPLLRVTAPIIEAQIVETYLLSTINFQTSIASKAARVCHAARGRGVVEFGTRRAHGAQAGVMAARAAYIGGCIGTSNVLAGRELGIPIYGTMAHSFVMAFENETEAFLKYQKIFPDSATLLVDTYDTIEGVKKAIAIGVPFQGVRLDSGNLLELSRKARKLLDDAGLRHVKIVASGDLNEEIMYNLTSHRAPIDMFGVGTELATSRDQPALSGIYKLVEQRKENQLFRTAKHSKKKETYPGSKQVYRAIDSNGRFVRDVITLAEEPAPKGSVAILAKTMREGKVIAEQPDIKEIRARALRQLEQLPARYKKLFNANEYPVIKSRALEKLRETIAQGTDVIIK